MMTATVTVICLGRIELLPGMMGEAFRDSADVPSTGQPIQ